MTPIEELKILIQKGYKSDSPEVKNCMKKMPRESHSTATMMLALSRLNKRAYPSTEI